ncbi:MAG TPA: UDP-N-acetylglucosamine 2-epimerase [bacterium]|nr:UDP-N-acetylglucosamine 2-epimerase [bacterium]
MIRAPSLLGLAGYVSPKALEREIDRQRRINREPTVTDLLPGVLGASLLKVCRDKGVTVTTSEAILGREGIRRVDAESKELTDRALETLGRDDVTRVIWHLFYWYRLRRACLGAAILDSALTESFYATTLLGGEELLAGVLDEVCRGKGVRLTAPGMVPTSFTRRLRTSRVGAGPSITLNEGLARWLKLAVSLLRSLGKRESPTPVDGLILTTLPSERATWRSVLDGIPEGLRVGLATTYRVRPRDLPPAVRRYSLDVRVRSKRLDEWIGTYRSYWRIGPELPQILPRLPWRGLDLGEYTRGWLTSVIRQLFWRLIPRASALEELIEAVRPRLLVSLTERNDLVNLAFRMAAARGIPTLAIESHDMVWDSPLFGRVEADRLAVSGAYSENIYAKNGVPREKMVVTGQPSFDGLVRYREKEPVKKETDERLLVVITQPPDVALTDDTRREMLRGAFLAAREIPRLRVLVKPHPRENLGDLRLILSELGAPRDALLPKKLDLYGLLASSDVILTAFSTVGVEAIMLGRPVVVFRTGEEPPVLPYVDSEAVLGAKDAEQIAERIKLVIEGEVIHKLAQGRDEYIARHECAADGGSGARVVRLILEMLNGEGRAGI